MSDEEGIDANYAALISSWDLKEPEKKKTGKRRNEANAEYEKKPRSFDIDQDESLPIKLTTGAVVKKPRSESILNKPIVEKPEVTPKNGKREEKKEKDFTSKKIEKIEKSTEKDIKQQIALLASAILEDPSLNAFKLRDVFNFTNLSKTSASTLTEQKLSILTLVAVYKDIVPGYYIRELSHVEKETKVSKEVEALRRFEFSVLRNYTEFARCLISAAKNPENLPIKPIAVKSLCELLLLSHFNLHEDILRCIVSLLNGDYGDICCDSLKMMFENDETGKGSCRAVEYISDMVKARDYKAKPRV